MISLFVLLTEYGSRRVNRWEVSNSPRQVRKTTLALRVAETRSSLYLDLERPADRAKLADAEFFLSQHADKLVILDITETTESGPDPRRLWLRGGFPESFLADHGPESLAWR